MIREKIKSKLKLGLKLTEREKCYYILFMGAIMNLQNQIIKSNLKSKELAEKVGTDASMIMRKIK